MPDTILLIILVIFPTNRYLCITRGKIFYISAGFWKH